MIERHPSAKLPEQQVGRYAIFDRIAAGGMATVHLARLTGSEGFSRVVAVKRMHPHLLENAEFRRMFVDEARLAARVRHPNVVPILDVLLNKHENELVIVMEYVHGDSLQALLRASHGAAVPPAIASAVLVSVLHGLHAAHEAQSENGEPLGIVHRDVSPHNVLVGADGVTRVLDFGIAKAVRARSDTNPGTLKGKFSYMAPELIRGQPATRQADVFSAAVVLWELLTGRKLFAGTTDQERVLRIVSGGYPTPSSVNPAITPAVDRIVMKGLEPNPEARFQHALDLAIALERELPSSSQRLVGAWVAELVPEVLAARTQLLQEVESSSVVSLATSVAPPPPEAAVSGTPLSFEASPSVRATSALPGSRARLLGVMAATGVTLALLASLVFFRRPNATAGGAANGSAASLVPAPAISALQLAAPALSTPTTAPPVAAASPPASALSPPPALQVHGAPSARTASQAPRHSKKVNDEKAFLPESL
jgi:eukaryotic-like serine/threonine-protein kinase